MNPFEVGVAGSEGLHAVMARHVAERGDRMVHGQRRPFFYNPMWGLLGDRHERVPGTCFFDQSGRPMNYFWNVFDQVLLRPSLLPYFRHENVDIITKVGNVDLTKNGVPDDKRYSDHLPLFFRLLALE